MPKSVTDIDVLRDYLNGVMTRADHHAGAVNEVALSLAGAIIWRKDNDPIEVMEREGEMKNVLWFKVSGKRFAVSYNHDAAAIELREGTTQGRAIGTFTNGTTSSDVRRIFEAL